MSTLYVCCYLERFKRFVVYILWHQDHASPGYFILGQLCCQPTHPHYTIVFPLDIRIAETNILPSVLLWLFPDKQALRFLKCDTGIVLGWGRIWGMGKESNSLGSLHQVRAFGFSKDFVLQCNGHRQWFEAIQWANLGSGICRQTEIKHSSQKFGFVTLTRHEEYLHITSSGRLGFGPLARPFSARATKGRKQLTSC